jgi:hypothetical protein
MCLGYGDPLTGVKMDCRAIVGAGEGIVGLGEFD